MTEDVFKAAFSLNLRKAIKNTGMTPMLVSKYSGISRSTIYNYMKGTRLPDLYNQFKLAEILCVRPEELIDFDEYGLESSIFNEGDDIYGQVRE